MKPDSSKLRIAVIIPSLANMGPIRVAFDLVEFLLPKVKSITVYYFDDKEEVHFNCEAIRIPFSYKIDEAKYDVIHSHGFRPDMYVAFHRFKKLKKVTTLHSNVFEELKSSHGNLLGWFFAKVWTLFLNHDKVVVLSNFVREFYLKRIWKGEQKLVTIYNARNVVLPIDIVVDKEREVLNFRRENGIILGAVSVLTKRKGVDQLLKAVKLNSNLALIIIGNGPEESNLKMQAIDLGIDSRVLFLGYQANAIGYYKFFDVFCLSSYSEGFPLGLLEAVQLKVPSVVSNLPIYMEMFDHELEVQKFDLDNIEDLNYNIEMAFENREVLIANSYKRVQSEYSLNVMGNKYLEVYE